MHGVAQSLVNLLLIFPSPAEFVTFVAWTLEQKGCLCFKNHEADWYFVYTCSLQCWAVHGVWQEEE